MFHLLHIISKCCLRLPSAINKYISFDFIYYYCIMCNNYRCCIKFHCVSNDMWSHREICCDMSILKKDARINHSSCTSMLEKNIIFNTLTYVELQDLRFLFHREIYWLSLTMTNVLCKIANFAFLTRVRWSYCVLEKNMRELIIHQCLKLQGLHFFSWLENE